MPCLVKKTFASGSKIVQFMKVFSLKNIQLYGNEQVLVLTISFMKCVSTCIEYANT